MLAAIVLAGISWSAVNVAGQSAPAAPTNVAVLPDGPAASWISIFPGSSIQAAVNANAGASTFYIRAGVHRRQQVNPKTGNVFVGEAGAVLDGENVAVYAFEGSGASGVVVRNLTVRNYLTGAQRGAFQGDTGPNWVLEDLTVHNNSYIGIRMGPGWRVRRSTVYRNGVIGISGYRAHGLLIENSTIYENNWLQAPEIPVNAAAAGIKLGETSNATIRNNVVRGNLAKGIWIDHCYPTTLIEQNTVSDNSHQGIWTEITHTAIVRNNLVERNAIGSGLRAGIHVTNSPSVEIYGNTLRDNGYSIRAAQNIGVNATTGPYGPLRLENLHVHDNIIRVRNQTASVGVSQDTGETIVFTGWNNRFENNDYTALSTTGAWFMWAGTNRTFASWQAVPQDAAGSLSVAP